MAVGRTPRAEQFVDGDQRHGGQDDRAAARGTRAAAGDDDKSSAGSRSVAAGPCGTMRGSRYDFAVIAGLEWSASFWPAPGHAASAYDTAARRIPWKPRYCTRARLAIPCNRFHRRHALRSQGQTMEFWLWIRPDSQAASVGEIWRSRSRVWFLRVSARNVRRRPAVSTSRHLVCITAFMRSPVSQRHRSSEAHQSPSGMPATVPVNRRASRISRATSSDV
jgi:hypothetical protein